MKFHENLFSGSWVVSCGRTDGQTANSRSTKCYERA